MRKLYCLLLLSMLLFVGCQWRLGTADDESDYLVSVSRYDRIQSLYLTTGDISALQQMNTEFPQQTRTLIEDVLQLGPVNDPQINRRFLSFYQDSTLQTVIAETQRQYADMSDVNKQLSEAFENLLKMQPSLCVPEVYAQIGSFDQSIVVAGDFLGISLDKYLGSDYPLYLKFGYSADQRQQMQRSYIVPDCIAFFLLYHYPLPDGMDTVPELRDRHIGRVQWVVNRVLKKSFFNTPSVREADRYMKSHHGMTTDQHLFSEFLR